MDAVQFIQDLTTKVTAIAWSMFILTWSIGWTLKGAPIPFARLKRTGDSLIEDSIWASFWLAMGTTVFALVSYVVRSITG
ncbi:MAG: hypothetical protein GSR76_05225 [Desulfurococcales archaeon]|nr:hypothetical protein [Desulfurococcales archaeon]MEB3798931.1 hypothetical protein [Desulfurococcales archaeon]